MTQVMRTILQDGILYFFVMAGFHVAMLFFTIVGKVTIFFPFAERTLLTPPRPSLPFSLQSRLWCTCLLYVPVEFVANPDP